mmetsp:Transcript_31856/g.71578  ORF Transcript_31856/g.71578 Transcript_31856/m.71578 type:complete len:217 (-) Transcript_31856:48-698(-)
MSMSDDLSDHAVMIARDTDDLGSTNGIAPAYQNVVATVNLGCKLNLRTIAQRARNAEYRPTHFDAVIMRIREPKTTALIFVTGKMICTGAKSEEDARVASRKFVRIIQKIGFQASFRAFKVQNLVASCDVGFRVRLETIASVHHNYCTYEPEIFPGLVYRMLEIKVVVLVFHSGKLVLTGAKSKRDIDIAWNLIYPVLLDSRLKILSRGVADGDEP